MSFMTLILTSNPESESLSPPVLLGLAAAFGVIEQLLRAASEALTPWATTASMSSESDMFVPRCKKKLQNCKSCVAKQSVCRKLELGMA
jgi:hypothetical protein